MATAVSQAAFAPTRENFFDPAPSETAMIVQPPLMSKWNQSSQFVPSCLCFLRRARAPMSRKPSGDLALRLSDSSCSSGSYFGTGSHFHCGAGGLLVVTGSAWASPAAGDAFAPALFSSLLAGMVSSVSSESLALVSFSTADDPSTTPPRRRLPPASRTG